MSGFLHAERLAQHYNGKPLSYSQPAAPPPSSRNPAERIRIKTAFDRQENAGSSASNSKREKTVRTIAETLLPEVNRGTRRMRITLWRTSAGSVILLKRPCRIIRSCIPAGRVFPGVLPPALPDCSSLKFRECREGTMKSYRKELWFNTKNRVEFINITPDVEQCLRESGIREGLVLCNTKHI